MRRAWFLAGLFLTTLCTLALEILDTRLLSVVTWYHLSFFAVSTALFGMSAGAVRVFLGGAAFEGENAPRALSRAALLFALALPLCHAANLYVPLDVGASPRNLAALVVTTAALAVPFYLSGIAVAVALTRIPGPSGLVYAVDLAGAALGSLLVLPLLRFLDISSAALVLSALAAGGAACFRAFAGQGVASAGVLAVALLAAAALNTATPDGLRVVYAKGSRLDRSEIAAEHWTLHGQILARTSRRAIPYYWGAGRRTPVREVEHVPIWVDGGAGTVMTRWDGRPGSLGWVKHDVTSLPFHLRQRGRVAVIGVGGGRDLLTAVWARSRQITGIEVNGALVRLLRDDYRDYANLAQRPELRLVHDEARSYLTRTRDRFDVLQMSLIDTWAATGAGAFTLSENGLYTLEAWRTFLGVLAPGGLFSVSRWYAPERASETSRLLALAVAALLERGVADPRAHLALVAGGEQVATLLVARDPFSARDLALLRRSVRQQGFDLLLAPDAPASEPQLRNIAASRTRAELDRAVEHPLFDYTPPTDARPYFFNILHPRALLSQADEVGGRGVVAKGNLAATLTLLLLWGVSAAGVVGVILVPLARADLPHMAPGDFAHALLYFALIGSGFMLVQVPLMQRFSVYLGHPTYAVAVTLFSMIAAAGIGSALSDRLPIERDLRLAAGVPLGIAAILLLTTLSLQPLMDATIEGGLLLRATLVVGVVACASLPLGFCFPLGLRLVRRLPGDATPWMWGINGACGVLAAVTAVAISMWSGIDTSLGLATLAYGLLSLPAVALWRRGRRAAGVTPPI